MKFFTITNFVQETRIVTTVNVDCKNENEIANWVAELKEIYKGYALHEIRKQLTRNNIDAKGDIFECAARYHENNLSEIC